MISTVFSEPKIAGDLARAITKRREMERSARILNITTRRDKAIRRWKRRAALRSFTLEIKHELKSSFVVFMFFTLNALAVFFIGACVVGIIALGIQLCRFLHS